jgi:hypothetical protein
MVWESNVNKAWIKDNLFGIGELLIVASAVFIGLFLATNLAEITVFASFAGGFAIAGFFSLFFGFTLTIIDAYFLETETDLTKRNKNILTAVTALCLILLGYSISTNSEWTIRPLIIENIAGIAIQPSYAFYPEIIVSSNTLFYATMLTFGILVLPFIFAETGLLDDKTDKMIQDYEQGQTLEDAEKTFDRFTVFLKRKIGSRDNLQNTRTIKMLKKLTVPAAAAFAVVGACLVVLPYFLVKDGPLTVDPQGVEYIKDYMGVLRGQLLLLGILFLIVAVVLIVIYRKYK